MIATRVEFGTEPEIAMAKGQMRSSKEKKKPKAEWNKKKGAEEAAQIPARMSAYKAAYGVAGKKA